MRNGPRPIRSRRPDPARPFSNRSQQRMSNVARTGPRVSQTAQRSYERYLALAKAQAQSAI